MPAILWTAGIQFDRARLIGAPGTGQKPDQTRDVGSLIVVARCASVVPDALPGADDATGPPDGAVSTMDVRTGAATAAENSNAKELVLMVDS
ncbi:hypothetical protein R52603_04735 [Paraburkholderia saeva]|uniref:Uncharacterized protein n=2 Tax=Paraburkholderia saeva TaxID=2777537 RepID=A0A9N8RUZ8_9BURK|nr:hypothetical protein LMG31841_01481 [Paraburkholderia saeva]CAG4919275.1 hypothetical protein R52603_04735 [Paraburkholderia saeva]